MKKIFTILAACALSISASAQLTYITGLYKDKSVAVNSDGTYTLTLDTWCNGTTVLEEKMTSKNANVVLVIDESGSMGLYSNYIKVGTVQTDSITVKNSSNVVIEPDKSIYYCDKNERIVRWNPTTGRWQYYSGGWKPFPYHTTSGFSTKYYDELYVCGFSAVATSVQKLLNNLISDVRACAKNNVNIEHKIAIYSFAGKSYEKLGDLTSVTGDSAKIINTVLALEMGGGTSPASALSNAVNKVGSSNTTTSANIIFFTDGNPDDDSYMTNSIKNVTDAKTNNGVKIFSIGYLTSLSSNVEHFLEGVSSDYPSATDYTNLGAKKDSCYFKNTSDPMELVHYFDNAAFQIAKEAKTYEMNALTQVRDTLTNEFILPSLEASQVSTYTIDCNGLDASGNPTFDGVEDAVSGLSVTIGADKKSVEVHGFDFGANFCGKHYNSSTGLVTVSGKKLRMKFKIKATDAFQGGVVNTNTKYSGIYPNGGTVLGTKFISPIVVGPVDLIVSSNHLNNPHESMIFKVTRKAKGASSIDTSFGINGEYEIILSGITEADTIKKCLTNVGNDSNNPFYDYTVETQSIGRDSRWDWRYDSDPTKRSLTHPLYDTINSVIDNIYPFTRSEKSGLPKTAEDVNTQLFKF